MHLDECALNRRLSNPAAQTKQMAAIRAAPLWPRASLAAMARGEPAGRLNSLEYQKVARGRDFFRRFENRQQRVAAVPAAGDRHSINALRHPCYTAWRRVLLQRFCTQNSTVPIHCRARAEFSSPDALLQTSNNAIETLYQALRIDKRTRCFGERRQRQQYIRCFNTLFE